MKTITIIAYVVFFNIIPCLFLIVTFMLDSAETFMLGFVYTMISALIFVGIQNNKNKECPFDDCDTCK